MNELKIIILLVCTCIAFIGGIYFKSCPEPEASISINTMCKEILGCDDCVYIIDEENQTYTAECIEWEG